MTTTATAYSPVHVQPESVAARQRVVVGMDDSPASLAALRFAAVEAAYRNADVTAVHIWHYPSTWEWAYERDLGPDILAPLQQTVDTVIAERAAAGQPVVQITAEIVEGDALTMLRGAAGGAALLVLGARHHNRFLGSVSQACASRPPCPVVVVPASAAPAGPVETNPS